MGSHRSIANPATAILCWCMSSCALPAWGAEDPLHPVGGSPASDIPIVQSFTARLVMHPDEVATVSETIVPIPGTPFTPMRIERSCGCLAGPDIAESPILAPTPFRIQVAADRDPGISEVRVRIIGVQDAHPAAIVCTITKDVQESLVSSAGSWKSQDMDPIGQSADQVEKTLNFSHGPHPERWDRITVGIHGEGGLWQAAVVEHEGTLGIPVRFQPQGMIGEVAALLRFSLFSGGRELDYHPTMLIRAHVHGSLQAQPSRVLIGVVELGHSATVRIGLTSAGELPPIERIVASDPARLTATLVSEGGHAAIEATFLAREPLGQASGWLDVVVADARHSILRIPYLAAAAAPTIRE